MEEAAVSHEYVTLAEGVIASDYALKNLNKALGEAQNEFTPSFKSEENKWGGYKYTPLVAIIAATRPALVKHHLTVSQFPLTDLERKTVSMVTRLSHWDSGEWIQNTFELPGELALGKDGTARFNQQTIGGSATYGQKYPYKAILGAADSEEMIDSTEEKGDLPARPKAQRGASQKAPDSSNSGMRSQFFSKAKEYGWGLGDIKEYLKRAYPESRSTADLSEEQMAAALNIMAQNKPEAVLQTEEAAA